MSIKDVNATLALSQSIENKDQSIEKDESQTHITHHDKLEEERECKEILSGSETIIQELVDRRIPKEG
jgi:hypothetical protein